MIIGYQCNCVCHDKAENCPSKNKHHNITLETKIYTHIHAHVHTHTHTQCKYMSLSYTGKMCTSHQVSDSSSKLVLRAQSTTEDYIRAR